MRIAVHSNDAAHQARAASVFTSGARRHGIDVVEAGYDEPTTCDVAVVWGWRQDKVKAACAAAGAPVLVMERGHVPPRDRWTSLGWNGLGGRSVRPEAPDGGRRWRMHHGSLLRPWRRTTAAAALVIGQVAGDASLAHVDFPRWAQARCDEAADLGMSVTYRPHPLSTPLGYSWVPSRVRIAQPSETLEESLARADVVCTFNSTTGVEAVLAGVPTVAFDKGSIAWPMSSRSLAAPLERPSRERWAADLAWSQWTEEEISSGEAWATLAGCKPDRGPELRMERPGHG